MYVEEMNFMRSGDGNKYKIISFVKKSLEYLGTVLRRNRVSSPSLKE
jgi:hypothetical protein